MLRSSMGFRHFQRLWDFSHWDEKLRMMLAWFLQMVARL